MKSPQIYVSHNSEPVEAIQVTLDNVDEIVAWLGPLPEDTLPAHMKPMSIPVPSTRSSGEVVCAFRANLDDWVVKNKAGQYMCFWDAQFHFLYHQKEAA